MSEQTPETAEQYLYGIVPAEAQLPSGLVGVHDQPVRLKKHGQVAAVLSATDPVEALGTPEDLLAHTRVLDSLGSSGPVLPLAFGTLVPDEQVLVTDVLEPQQDAYYAGLQDIAGHCQYTVTVTFDRETLLREVLDEVPEAADLREAIAGTTEDQTRPQRIRLGELMVNAFEARQPAAADPVLDRLDEAAARMVVHERRQPDDVAETAVLVANEQTHAFEQTVEELAQKYHPRLRFRLLGPQAPYDFVPVG
ncbi:GvpL/GvpF family gas vesicle protein [Nesterenkonia rhizosphaerae]|uniref:Gas vesicle protein GvpFL n=1 Tax=Nesterenkonia rhizosphaerae TaxID=1348272 RepID=A0ABP9FUR0_9MICC